MGKNTRKKKRRFFYTYWGKKIDYIGFTESIIVMKLNFKKTNAFCDIWHILAMMCHFISWVTTIRAIRIDSFCFFLLFRIVIDLFISLLIPLKRQWHIIENAIVVQNRRISPLVQGQVITKHALIVRALQKPLLSRYDNKIVETKSTFYTNNNRPWTIKTQIAAIENWFFFFTISFRFSLTEIGIKQ